jgi:hypothetical protein
MKPRRKIILCHSSPQQSCRVFWKVLDKPLLYKGLIMGYIKKIIKIKEE